MREQLMGSWKHEGEYDGTRTETTITIDAAGHFVTRMDYQMPESRQIVEHHGTIEVEDEWFKINLVRGCTQEYHGDGNEAGILREFTKAEFDETFDLLSQKIGYRITSEGFLETKVLGPSGPMTIVYAPCQL